jgi:hypothetical protein
MQSTAKRLQFGVVALLGALCGCSGTNGSQPPASDVDVAGTDSGGKGPADGAVPDASSHDAPSGFDTGTQDAGGAEDAAAEDGPLPDDSGSTSDASDLTVTWGTACWDVDTGHKYQAMPFQLVTSSPVPLEATLYFDTTCDPSNGTDNLNDTGGTIGSGGWVFWFIHHPDMPNTSAVWSLGSQTSGCIDYSKAPDCN